MQSQATMFLFLLTSHTSFAASRLLVQRLEQHKNKCVVCNTNLEQNSQAERYYSNRQSAIATEVLPWKSVSFVRSMKQEEANKQKHKKTTKTTHIIKIKKK